MAKKKSEESNVVVVDTNAIKKEVIDYVDIELDKRIDKFVTEKIKKEFIEEVNKANNRVIREKNKKLFVKNIIILILLCAIAGLIYLLYTENYFDRFFNNNNKTTPQQETVKENSGVIEEIAPSLDELKNEYASYIDPYILSDKSIYLEDFYQGNLTDEIKNYLTLNSIDFNNLETEDDYQMIDSKLISDVCSNLFDKKCKNVSFDYNGNKIRYFDKLESYVSNSILEREDTSIIREITNIETNKNTVTIETIEGLLIDNQISKIFPNEYIGEYNGDILSYTDQLNRVRYTFNNKKLVSIENL